MARLRILAELWDLKDTRKDLGAQIRKGEMGPALARLDELDCSLKCKNQESAEKLTQDYIGRLLQIYDTTPDQKIYGLFQIEDPITINIIIEWATCISMPSIYDGLNFGIIPRITYRERMIDGEKQIVDILFHSFYITTKSKKEFKIVEDSPDFRNII